jgi:alpha/beta superfamily hydrolase
LIALPANLYDFSFRPCPSFGLIIHGDMTRWCRIRMSLARSRKVKTQKGIVIEQRIVPAANHFFDSKIDVRFLMTAVIGYLGQASRRRRAT